MTPGVGRPTPNSATVRNAIEALAAADLYVNRLIPHLSEVALLYREERLAEAREALAGAVSGIGFLVDLVAAVSGATGVDTLPSTDHELGRVALSLQALAAAGSDRNVPALVATLEDDLIPALARLAPSFAGLEARVAACA